MWLFHSCVGVLLVLLSCKHADAALGTGCADDTECTVANAECRDDVCACVPGFVTAGDACAEGSGRLQDRQALYRKLFKDYNKDLAPDGADGGPVVVSHSLTMERLVSLEEGVLTMVLWEEMSWNDHRLTWDPKANNIGISHVPSELIWKPDILLYNSAEEYSGFPSKDIHAVIKSDGNVKFIPPRVTKSICQFDESDLYETNEVVCTLKYGSWVRSLQHLDLRSSHEPDTYYLVPNIHWEVVSANTVRNVNKYSCCPDSYVDIEYQIRIKRIK